MADPSTGAHEEGRRDFLYVATGTVAALGTVLAAWPLIDQLNPAADVLALSSIEVDLAPIRPGQQITVNWRGKPVFVRHRTPEDIEEARAVALDELRDPEADEERATKPQWLVMVGVCTHLGCVPLADSGDFRGWFCPCHGSHYDTSGRIRKGPAPNNLPVPDHTFLDDDTIRIG